MSHLRTEFKHILSSVLFMIFLALSNEFACTKILVTGFLTNDNTYILNRNIHASISNYYPKSLPLNVYNEIQCSSKKNNENAEENTIVTKQSTENEGNINPKYAKKVKAWRPINLHKFGGSPNASKEKGGSSKDRVIRPQGQVLESGMKNPSKLRIAGGSKKGKRIDSPEVYLRPMMGKVKEALFSTLTSFGFFTQENTKILDLYCGSGSVGLEALSRGVDKSVHVDMAKECCNVVERNLQLLEFDGRGRSVCGKVEDVLENPRGFGVTEVFDLVTVTPPYEEVVYGDLLQQLATSDCLGEDSIVVIEYPIELDTLPFNVGNGRMLGARNRKYGRTIVAIYVVNPTGALDIDLRPEEFESRKKKGGN